MQFVPERVADRQASHRKSPTAVRAEMICEVRPFWPHPNLTFFGRIQIDFALRNIIFFDCLTCTKACGK